MAGPVTDTHRIKYLENFKLAVQEKKNQFERAAMYVGTISGKQVQILNIIGETEARLNAPEGGQTPNIENSHEPVWVKPDRIDWGKLMSIEDYIKAGTDYKSPYIQSGVNAMTRTKNGLFFANALFGNRLIGNEVPVPTPWAGQTVAKTVGSADGVTNVGMNVKKILRAFRLMEEQNVEIEEHQLFLGLDAQENEELYYDITYVSKDYRDKAVLEEKRVRSILGVEILPTQRIAKADATTSQAALWAKEGMAWGPAMPLTIKSQENVDRQYREHPYAEEWIGMTRTDDKLVVKILNHQP